MLRKQACLSNWLGVTATSLQEARQPASVKALQHVTVDDLKSNGQILSVASTYGTGEAPDLAGKF